MSLICCIFLFGIWVRCIFVWICLIRFGVISMMVMNILLICILIVCVIRLNVIWLCCSVFRWYGGVVINWLMVVRVYWYDLFDFVLVFVGGVLCVVVGVLCGVGDDLDV